MPECIKLSTWFNPMDIAHVRAWKHLCDKGVWPECFIPKH